MTAGAYGTEEEEGEEGEEGEEEGGGVPQRNNNKHPRIGDVFCHDMALMACVLLLENALSVEKIKPSAKKLHSNLPTNTKAVAEATLSSVALRVFLLDRGINFSATSVGKEKRQGKLTLSNV